MKVLQLGKFYPIRGGVEKVMYDLMLGLSERGIRCDMLCATTEDHPAGELYVNELATVFAMPTQVKLAATMIAPTMVTKLRRIAKNYDIIHVHHPDPMACLALFLSGYRGKVLLHWHSDILKQKFLLKLYGPLQKWLIHRANLIVGTTPVYVEESPFLNNVQNKVDYIPIGVEPMPVDREGAGRIRDRFQGKKLIFSLGRLVEYKGYEHLIESATYLDDQYKIIIGGKGPLEGELKQLIQKLNVQDRVELLGFVEDKDIPAFYGASALFCLSSTMKTEAFAIVQIEAMSLGIPIVSTHIPGSGVSWVNQDKESGLVVPAHDAHAIATAIATILSDFQLYEKLSQNSYMRFDRLFTRTKMIDRTLSIYSKLLKTTMK